MTRRNRLSDITNLAGSMIRHNLRIIFAGRFLWFLLGAVAFWMGLSVIYVFSEDISRMEDLYGVFLFCGILLVFYPTVFGIQNDQDSRTIEILFGIPNYRYKVWLVRVLLIFIIAFLVLLLFTATSSVLIVKYRPLQMASQVMIPVLMLGMMSFMLSTFIRNGNGTAVVMIIIGILFTMLADTLEKSKWNIFLNPFSLPSDISERAWDSIVLNNRIILGVLTAIFLVTALYNLQKREKFM